MNPHPPNNPPDLGEYIKLFHKKYEALWFAAWPSDEINLGLKDDDPRRENEIAFATQGQYAARGVVRSEFNPQPLIDLVDNFDGGWIPEALAQLPWARGHQPGFWRKTVKGVVAVTVASARHRGTRKQKEPITCVTDWYTCQICGYGDLTKVTADRVPPHTFAFMLKPGLWHRLFPGDGLACLTCVVERLGRPLEVDDLGQGNLGPANIGLFRALGAQDLARKIEEKMPRGWLAPG